LINSFHGVFLSLLSEAQNSMELAADINIQELSHMLVAVVLGINVGRVLKWRALRYRQWLTVPLTSLLHDVMARRMMGQYIFLSILARLFKIDKTLCLRTLKSKGRLMMDLKQMIAPCGLACWACAAYKDNMTDERARQTAAMLKMDAKDVSCDGCRSERGCSVACVLAGEEGCLTKKCVEEKGLHNCSECNGFPCEYLMPVADWADRVPHNTKLYNLSRIKLIGFDAWAEEAQVIQQKYFMGKFVYGKDPAL
jgi:hypothetical protein